MIRLPIALAAAVAAAAAAIGTVSAAPQAPAFHAGTDTVSVYATVVDRSGRLLTNLGRDDFEVFDNGKRQDLVLFANDIQPITIVVMLDRSESMKRNFDLVRDAAERFVLLLGPSDKARLGSFSDHVRIDPDTFTSDQGELIRILHERLLDPGATPLWGATADAMTALAHQPGRRVVLVFTDGADSPSLNGPNVTFKDVLDRSQTEETMIYAIGLSDPCGPSPRGIEPAPPRIEFQQRGGRIGGAPPGGRIGGPPPGGGRIGGVRPGRFPPRTGGLGSDDGKPCASVKPDPELRDLADDGGGGYFELRGTDDLQSTFARIADELHHQYLLGFNAATRDGRMHTLEVRARPSNAVVRARRGYLAPDGLTSRR